jgi:hypothetical protein
MISRFIATLLLFGFSVPCEAFSLNRVVSQQTGTALSMGLFGSGGSDILKDMFQPKPDGPKVVMELPVEDIKPKPLRFFLQIYIVGQQNSRQSQTWLPKESEEGSLQVYFKDGTGMCNIVLGNDSIRIERHGQKPSLQYMLQESVMLHGVLDELNQVAFEVEDVKDGQRLLKLDKAVLDKARDNLPARQA